MLEMEWDKYEKAMKEIDPDYVELAGLYALTKEDLINRFKSYCKYKNKLFMLEALINDDIQVDFIGEGYYDLCGFEYGLPMIMRIDETLKSQV